MTRMLVMGAGATAVAALAYTAPIGLVPLAGVAGAAGLGWFALRCRHTAHVGLLPPTTQADGTRLPARWFCDDCGREWPASFERTTTPIVKFSGYDQSKAPAAARQAADLEARHKAAAVRRAGYAGRARAGRVREAGPAPLVAFDPTRARVAR